MAERCIVPRVPKDWDTLANPEKKRFAKTYNYFSSPEASSAFQKSVRRGKIEAIQWALELYWTGKWQRTNIWNRILVVCVEDIGLACPTLISLVYSMRKEAAEYEKEWSPGAYVILAQAVELCVNARKSRLNDWAAHVIKLSKEDLDTKDADKRLIQSLRDKDPLACLKWAEVLWETRGRLWQCLEKEVGGIAKTIYKDVYELGTSTNWRWQRKTRLLWIHLIMLHCYEHVIDKDSADPRRIPTMEVGDPESPTEGTLVWEIVKVYTRQCIVGVPEYALDKHTARGRAMGRSLDHFIQVGAVLENRAKELIDLEDQYLELMQRA